ncbi:hypothetical protein LFX25_03445 [Leptospira sp. FAT2]|uniref:hypothetical protein n=1 Tax=Leptospira sanjuanensis TaxID=2879643 RepID=UPI001EE907BC|nr:hypothetical protein [Leptospira sanjuanensis]MCG6192294.1 hypothetical protein [Leptospira sanjuanensis]
MQPIEKYCENEIKVKSLRDKLNKINAAGEINNANWKEFSEIDALNKLVRETEIGTTIGLNKFSDDLILNWNGNKTLSNLLIIIGHDWYPLVGNGYEFNSIFQIYPMTKEGIKYNQCLLDFDCEKNLVLMFNLIPGYRFPYSWQSGSFLENRLYEEKAESLVSIINKVKEGFLNYRIISWGNEVKNRMKRFFDNGAIFNLPHPSVYSYDRMKKAKEYYEFIKFDNNESK